MRISDGRKGKLGKWKASKGTISDAEGKLLGAHCSFVPDCQGVYPHPLRVLYCTASAVQSYAVLYRQRCTDFCLCPLPPCVYTTPQARVHACLCERMLSVLRVLLSCWSVRASVSVTVLCAAVCARTYMCIS